MFGLRILSFLEDTQVASRGKSGTGLGRRRCWRIIFYLYVYINIVSYFTFGVQGSSLSDPFHQA